MKKVLMMMLLMIASLSLVGCFAEENTDWPELTPSTPEEEEVIEDKVHNLLEGLMYQELKTIELNVSEYSSFELTLKSKYKGGTPIYITSLKINNELLDLRNSDEVKNAKSSSKYSGLINVNDKEIETKNIYTSKPKTDLEIDPYALWGNDVDEGLIKFDLKEIDSIELIFMVSTSSQLNAFDYAEIRIK